MATEIITLKVAGHPLPHTRCQLAAGAEQGVRTASFDVAWTGPGLPCREDTPCVVMVGRDLWLTGYVRDVNWEHDRDSRRYSVSVVSRTVDATETSIDHPTGSAVKVTLEEIAKTFDSAGVGVHVMFETAKKAVHQINPGDTLFRMLETEARAHGALIYDTPQGKLKIIDKPEGRHAGALILGRNIIRASGTLSGRFNYDKVKVRGQSSFGRGGGALRPEAEAKGTADRKRTLIIYHEGEATSDRVMKRAAWESKRAAGKGNTARCTVSGCRDEKGLIYASNHLIPVQDDWGGLRQDMIIASLSIEQDGDGTLTELTLKDPRALGGENPRGDSAKGWAAPGAAPPTFRED